jgi:hypothetical protein
MYRAIIKIENPIRRWLSFVYKLPKRKSLSYLKASQEKKKQIAIERF